MGMSTHIMGIKPPDEKWKRMKSAYDACMNADIDVPEEIWEFFNHEEPDDKGVKIELEDTPAAQEFSDEGRQGFEIELSKLPKDVTLVRFYNSW